MGRVAGSRRSQMAKDSRQNSPVFSGLTRREQQVLVFLIVVIGAGLAYQYYSGGSRRQSLVLHRGNGNAGFPDESPHDGSGQRPGSRDSAGGPGERVDLNAASAGELERLPGIGPVKAKRIVDDRAAKGPYSRIEDLDRVVGIGEKTIEALRPYLKPIVAATSKTTGAWVPGRVADTLEVTPRPMPSPKPTVVNVNTAGEEELCALKGIGPALAKRIVEYRKKRGPFRTPNDLQRVRGIGPVVLRDNLGRIKVSPTR